MEQPTTIGELIRQASGSRCSDLQIQTSSSRYDEEEVRLSQLDAMMESEEPVSREDAINHHLQVQMEKEEARRQRQAEKEEEQRQSKEAIREYSKLLKAEAPKDEGSDEWFLRALMQKTALKKKVKITHYQDRVRQYLLLAYKRRVECDNRQFAYDNNTERVIGFIEQWMRDSQYNGLILRGNCGIGKTTMMRAIGDVFSILEQLHTREVTASEVASMSVEDPKAFRALCDCPMLAIDDLGTEAPTIKSYGNEVSPMVELLTQRHRKLLFTVITTNLISHPTGQDQIKERYGERVLDRLCELCAIVQYIEMQSYRTRI